jgi:hypothetical protein
MFRRKTRHACPFFLGFTMMVCPWILKGQDPFSRVTESCLSEEAGRFLTPSWGDFDDDGWVDLFVTRKDGGSCRLYRNMGNGTFEMIEDGGFAEPGNFGHAGCWADYDNDGNLDVLITRWGGDSQAVALYRGNGSGGFEKITTGDIARPGENSCSASWGDYNLDGYLDLHVGNYDDRNWLFKNEGDGTFSSVNAGIVTALSGRSTSISWIDYQADGYPDLFVGNTGQTQAYLFYGGLDGQFTRVTGVPPALDSSGYWLGADWSDYDNDGDPDLYVTSFNGMDRLYMNEGDGSFSVTRGVMPSVGTQTLHPAWGDYDNDGWVDLYVSCGNTSAARSKLYRNLGDGSFEDISDSVTVSDFVHSGGCCWGDYDNDGFLDLFVARGNYNTSRENALFHNNGNDNSWIKVRLVGSGSARCGIGAKVRVLAHIGGDDIWQLREISGGSGTGGSQNGLIAHFGLGNADMVETLRIEWPSGAIQELGPMIARQSITVTEPPRISSMNLLSGQSVELHVSAWPGQEFEVEASSDLSEWSTIGVAEVGPDRLIQIEDAEGEDAISRFFRLTIPKLQSVAQ